MTQNSNPSALTRRNFLKAAGATLGGATLACVGLGYLAARPPAIDMTQTECKGETDMGKKVLVAYASKSGTTVEVAEAIGKALCAGGANAEVRPIKSITRLDGYQAVVAGSAIRMGAWLPEAVKFVEANQAQLKQVRMAIFTVHLLALDDSPESQAQRASYIAPLLKMITPDQTAFFAGRMDFSKLSFFERTISKAMKARQEDRRDWNKIGAWAEGLVPAMALAG